MDGPDMTALLGGAAALGRPVPDALALADAIAEGLPWAVADDVRERTGVTDVELATLLGVSVKALQRLARQPQGRLGALQSDRLYRLARLFALAERVLCDAGAARAWLRTPAPGLGERSPLDLMRTELGARQIENLLGCLEYGLYA